MTSFDPHAPEASPLGKPAVYQTQYNPGLLFPMARQPMRNELGITGTAPFYGIDIWNAYEVSWLNLRGKPQIAIACVTVPADSPNIIESKSFKLYLNSFNQTKLPSTDALLDVLRTDLSAGFGATVHVALTTQDAFDKIKVAELDGLLLDRLDIEIDNYAPDATLLRADLQQSPVEEVLVSHLLKSNCLITGQPDWGSVQIHYAGPQINQESLLRYLIGFRTHNEFHEQCVERIFMDLMHHCKPHKLAVYARYTRRGGLDINPWRSNFTTARPPSNARSARQ